MYQEVTKMIQAFEQGKLNRRQLAAHVCALAAAVAGTASGQDAPASTFQATGLDHIALRVSDVARSRDFYIRHLGLTVSSDDSPNNCFLNCGKDFVALFRGSDTGLDHYDGEEIDLGRLATEQAVLGLDGTLLCSPDCRGLCSSCGTNLNHETCRCGADGTDGTDG